MQNYFLTNRFFIGIGACIALLIVSYSFSVLFNLAMLGLVAMALLCFLDIYLLAQSHMKIQTNRTIHKRLSLGDQQDINYTITNQSNRDWNFELIDEFPYQLQLREVVAKGMLGQDSMERVHLDIRPLMRGSYAFGHLHLFITNPKLGFVERKLTSHIPINVQVFPSIIQMRKYAIQVFAQTATMRGIRRIRSVGENDEFEQIRLYQLGDNYKSINWKATSRKNELMVNQYQNTRSQNVYCIIDKGRSMKMPFDGLTLLDYAINASLVISNIVIKKYDLSGLLTFSNRIGQLVSATNSPNQLNFILEQLYNQKTDFEESNHELLFHFVRQHIKRRSILFYFSNFENEHDLSRNLEFLRSLNRRHLLIMIFFTNSEMSRVREEAIDNYSDIYVQTFASEAIMEKEKIRDILKAHGIQTILTSPQQLSINVINKYLEIKAKHMR